MNVKFDFFMSQIKEIQVIKENEKTKISLVFYEKNQAPCILRICKNRNLCDVYSMLVNIRHPNVCVIYDYVYYHNNTYVLEEFINGKTLLETLNENGVFTEKQTAKLISDVCCGLEHLHNCKPAVIHNDIKTSNIMICDDGNVKLMDFDISRIYKEGAYKNTRLLGTEEYAAPEHYGFGQSEPCTDVYSLGITMHEMLTGKGLTNQHKMTYRGSLDKIIQKCIEIDTQKRYASARDLKFDLVKFLHRKNRILRTAVICGCTVLLAAAVIFVVNGKAIKPEQNEVKQEADVTESKKTETETEALAETAAASAEEAQMLIGDRKMKVVEKPEGELLSMAALPDGRFVMLEDKGDGYFYIKTSDGIEKQLALNAPYGSTLVYNNYSESLYLLGYDFLGINLYKMNDDFDAELRAGGMGSGHMDNAESERSCNFFSDGTMLCNVTHQVLDISNGAVLEDNIPEGTYVINDRLFRRGGADEECFIEIDKFGQSIMEYGLKGVHAYTSNKIYTDGAAAYFIGTLNDKDYVYRFDGENYEIVTCLSDYDNFTPFDYDFLCVSENAVRCYDKTSNEIKEFTLK